MNNNEWEKIREDILTATWRSAKRGEVLIDKELLNSLLQKQREEILQDLEIFLNDIPEAYGWGAEDEEANRGYQICSKAVKAELRRFIDQRLTPTKTDKQTEV